MIKARGIRLARFASLAEQTRRGIALQTSGPWVYPDEMAQSHADKLEMTLRNYLPANVPDSRLEQNKARKILPPGSHLVFFNHVVDETELSKDGYDGVQAPQGAFPVRRWYGGSVEFNINTQLKLDEPAVCVEHLQDLRSTPRSHRVNVTLSRSMKNENDDEPWAVRERRSMFYFGQDSLGLLKTQLTRKSEPNYVPRYQHAFRPSRILLFRYSALNFNAHLIHYDPVYSREVERLPDVCVQGPLMVTLLLRWMDEHVLAGSNRRIHVFDYRNVSPLIVDEEALLCATPITQDSFEVWIQTATGRVVLSGTIVVS